MTLELIGTGSLAEDLARASTSARPASPSSAWATSACRWPRRSPGAAIPCSASTSTPTRSTRCCAARATSATSAPSASPSWTAAAGSSRPAIPRRFAEADAIIICVPTPLGEAREPDLSYIIGTGRDAAPAPAAGPAGRAGEHDLPRHDRGRAAADPRRIGPEGRARISSWPTAPSAKIPATAISPRATSPRWSAASTTISRDLAVALYEPVVDGVVPVSSTRVAEACKILENTYRAVNIALVNELKGVFAAMGIDVWEVIDAAKTKPFGFQAFYPGPGPGRALHPHRPVLPDVGGATARPAHALHRAGRRGQHGHAAARRRPRRRGAQRRRQGRSRAAGSACWAWPTRRTWTIRASRRRFEILELLQRAARS